MKRHRHTPEQVVRKLREGERILNDGKDLTEVLRTLEISEATWNRWRSQYGGMKASEAKRLKELAEGNFVPRTAAAGPLATCGEGSGFPNGGRAGSSVRTAPPTACPGGPARTRRRGCVRSCDGSRAGIRGGGGGWPTGCCAAKLLRRGPR